MSTSCLDYSSPNVKFTYDMNKNVIFKKDNQNYLTALTIDQLNTLGRNSLLDIYLSNGGIIEPHYHQNAAELIYCVTGAAVVSILNPFTKELLHFPITPGQVANVPLGWWHYEIATVDCTHLLAIFDAPTIDTIFGSDILRLTPPQVLAYTYCLDEQKVKQVLAPITKTVVLGPPEGCNPMHSQVNSAAVANKSNMHHSMPVPLPVPIPMPIPASMNQTYRGHKPGCIYYQQPQPHG